MLEGRRFAQNDSLEIAAWMVAHLLSPWSKKPLTADDILGRERKPMEIDPEVIEEKKRKAMKLLRKIETASIARRETLTLWENGK